MKMVSSPHLKPCIDQSASGKGRFSGSYVKDIACGGRHSVVITDAGELLTFGWGLYGQCGQGNTKDQLKVTRVESLWDTRVKSIAAGLWHTLCISVDGRVYAFGGNQFGQLGTGAEEAEAKLKAAADLYVKEKYPDTELCDIPQLDLETEAMLCVKAFGERPGNQVKGLGLLGDGLLTKSPSSSRRRRSSAAEVEEANKRVEEANTVADKAREEAVEAKAEAKQAKKTAKRANDRADRLEKFLMSQFPDFCLQTTPPHSSDSDPDQIDDNVSAIDLGLA